MEARGVGRSQVGSSVSGTICRVSMDKGEIGIILGFSGWHGVTLCRLTDMSDCILFSGSLFIKLDRVEFL